MTKDMYFEMCETMGSEPLEEEVPVEYDDLAVEVQEALNIYSKLRDDWDRMGGNYLGKNLSGINEIFSIYGVEKNARRGLLDIILLIDISRAKAIEAKKPKTTNKPQ